MKTPNTQLTSNVASLLSALTVCFLVSNHAQGEEQKLRNSVAAVTQAANSMPPFPTGTGINFGSDSETDADQASNDVPSDTDSSLDTIETTFGSIVLSEGDQPADQIVAGKFLAFFTLGTLNGPPEPGGAIETGFIVTGFEDTIEQATFQNAVVAQADPYLGRTLRVTNPLDEGVLFRFETSLDIDTLDDATAVGEGLFSAEVLDTGGDQGAELSYSIGHTLREVDSGERLSVGLDFAGDVSEGSLDTLERSISGFGLGEDFDEILVSAFLTISPGDTAVITSIASFGDASTPLVATTEIQPILEFVDDFASDFTGIPEPSTAALLWVSGLGCVATTRNRIRAA